MHIPFQLRSLTSSCPLGPSSVTVIFGFYTVFGSDRIGHQVSKAQTLNPVTMAKLFLQGSSPDEICLCYDGTLSLEDAIRREKELESKINNGVRLFGFLLMYVSFCLVMRPLIWLLTFFWVFGAVLILVERFDRRGTDPNLLFRSEFVQNSEHAYLFSTSVE